MQKMKRTIEGSGTDLFICFTSRPSAASASAAGSASMRISSSKSLMSPSRSGSSNPSSIPSLSSSLSRRLRSSGSIKGGQSPMFPAAGVAVGRKKGVPFEAAEPSSPKVTCIGQVRVKSKKKKNKAKNMVSRSRSGREASFRRGEVAAGHGSGRRKAASFCDALRAFGSEMNCFAPCGWSLCNSRTEEADHRKKEKRSSSSSPSCGSVFARWLMAIEDGEREKGRELVGLVVDERRKGEVGVFVREKEMEIEFDEVQIFEKKEDVFVFEQGEEMVEEVEDEEGKGRVSVCVPPKNALLLMRCRSDPVRMAALANRFWDSPAMKVQCEEEEEEEEVGGDEETAEKEEGLMVGAHVEQSSIDAEEVEKEVVVNEDEERTIVAEEIEEEVEKVIVVDVITTEPPEKVEAEAEEAEDIDETREEAEDIDETRENDADKEEEIHVRRGEDEGEEVEIILRRSISCSATAKSSDSSKVKEGGRRRSYSCREKKENWRHSFSTEREARRHSFCSEKEARRTSVSSDKEGRRRSWSFSMEKENLGPREKPMIQSVKETKKHGMPAAAEEEPAEAAEEEPPAANEAKENMQLVGKREEEKSIELPDCLLLMMYEPKLSMEVSKETWVCSTDFLRWRPDHQMPSKSKPDGKIEEQCAENAKNVMEVPSEKPSPIVPQTPPKLPQEAGTPMEQKLQKSSAVGPLPQNFVLTRCKSEPLKSSDRLAPDACFWKDRHQPIGAAGIGF